MEAVVDLTEKTEEWESQRDQTYYIIGLRYKTSNFKNRHPPPQKKNGRRRGTCDHHPCPWVSMRSKQEGGNEME